MSPGAVMADVLGNAPGELLLVIASLGALLGLIRLYWFIRRSVIPNFIPGVAFRSVGARIISRAVIKRVTD